MIPQRVTDQLIGWLTGTRLTTIVVVHANHPQELDDDVVAALGKLIDAGVVVLNQSVLLRGINDSADTLTELVNNKKLCWNDGKVDQVVIDNYYADLTARNFSPHTCASAIETSRPVNLKKCLRAIDICDGVVRAVTDEQICDAKAIVGKFGLGCEPASAASIAGLKHLRAEGIIGPDEKIACVLTGHALKDPNVTVNYHKQKEGQFSNPPIESSNDLDEILKLIK